MPKGLNVLRPDGPARDHLGCRDLQVVKLPGPVESAKLAHPGRCRRPRHADNKDAVFKAFAGSKARCVTSSAWSTKTPTTSMY